VKVVQEISFPLLLTNTRWPGMKNHAAAAQKDDPFAPDSMTREDTI